MVKATSPNPQHHTHVCTHHGVQQVGVGAEHELSRERQVASGEVGAGLGLGAGGRQLLDVVNLQRGAQGRGGTDGEKSEEVQVLPDLACARQDWTVKGGRGQVG